MAQTARDAKGRNALNTTSSRSGNALRVTVTGTANGIEVRGKSRSYMVGIDKPPTLSTVRDLLTVNRKEGGKLPEGARRKAESAVLAEIKKHLNVNPLKRGMKPGESFEAHARRQIKAAKVLAKADRVKNRKLVLALLDEAGRSTYRLSGRLESQMDRDIGVIRASLGSARGGSGGIGPRGERVVYLVNEQIAKMQNADEDATPAEQLKAAKAAIRKARGGVTSAKKAGDVTGPQATRLRARIDAAAGRALYVEPTPRNGGNGSRQAGLSLVLKEKRRPGKPPPSKKRQPRSPYGGTATEAVAAKLTAYATRSGVPMAWGASATGSHYFGAVRGSGAPRDVTWTARSEKEGRAAIDAALAQFGRWAGKPTPATVAKKKATEGRATGKRLPAAQAKRLRVFQGMTLRYDSTYPTKADAEAHASDLRLVNIQYRIPGKAGAWHLYYDDSAISGGQTPKRNGNGNGKAKAPAKAKAKKAAAGGTVRRGSKRYDEVIRDSSTYRLYTLDNQFSGAPHPGGAPVLAGAKKSKAKLIDNADGTFTLSFHSNRWYKISGAPAPGNGKGAKKPPKTKTIGGVVHVLHAVRPTRGQATQEAARLRGDIERNVRADGDRWAVWIVDPDKPAKRNGNGPKWKASRSIDGKTYKLHGGDVTRSQAGDTAAKLRKGGQLARVIDYAPGAGLRSAVYVHGTPKRPGGGMAASKTGERGWPTRKKFNGDSYTLHAAHRKKAEADKHAKQLRNAPNPHLARVVGTRGEWAVYGRPKKNGAKAKTTRKAAKSGFTTTTIGGQKITSFRPPPSPLPNSKKWGKTTYKLIDEQTGKAGANKVAAAYRDRGWRARIHGKKGGPWGVYGIAPKGDTRGPAGWPKSRKFGDVAYRLDSRHTTEGAAKKQLKKLRQAGNLARRLGRKGDYAIYSKPKDWPVASSVAARAAIGRAQLGRQTTTKGGIKWVSWRPTGRMVVKEAKQGRGWVAIPSSGKKVRFQTLTALKQRYPGNWHRAGSKAAKTRPRAPTTAKSEIATRAYERSPKVRSYDRERGRLPNRDEEGKWIDDENPSKRTKKRRARRR